ncbi:MAG: rubrerythrin family protein [Armatimonadota bacterium]
MNDTTLANLKAAFNGESNANAAYAAFAQKADADGYAAVASLFRSTCKAEEIHFTREGDLVRKAGDEPVATINQPKVGTTAENLQHGISGETYETDEMYPEFLEQAEKLGERAAAKIFTYAMKAEAVHAKLYAAALADLESMKTPKVWYVCPYCGNVEAALGFGHCSICGAMEKDFLEIA